MALIGDEIALPVIVGRHVDRDIDHVACAKRGGIGGEDEIALVLRDKFRQGPAR